MNHVYRAWVGAGILALATASTSTVRADEPDPEPGPTITPIYEIQGEGHVSPYLDTFVTTEGIVTALAFNGFYVQDPDGDGNDNTADGMFVFDFRGLVEVGDHVRLADTVTEFIPGGASTGNLSTTQMSFPTLTGLSSGNHLPATTFIGRKGRIVPAEVVISDDETDPAINLQDAADAAANIFDPAEDAIDFYESLEGMLVTVDFPQAVSGTRTFSAFSSEVFTLANDGADARPFFVRTARGGISLNADPDNRGDQNGERVQIQFDGTLYPFPVPALKVGDLLGNVTGVVGYSFGNFEVNATEEVSVFAQQLPLERTDLVGTRKALTVASYNILNVTANPGDGDAAQLETLAGHIVDNMGVPDIIALQEVQDDSGVTDDGTTTAAETLQAIVDAIVDAGGPTYTAFNIDPDDNTQGGVPGGNIRNAFLYHDARVDLLDFTRLDETELTAAGASNPAAFVGTRIPLVGKFSFRGNDVFVVNNHFTSRFGSTPIFGGVQPFVQAGEDEREAESQAINDYVDYLLDGNPNQNIVVCGDLNTFEFTNDIREIITGAESGPNKVLFNLIDRLTDDNVYTFNFEGNSQVLDHVLVSRSLRHRAEVDIVHVNVDYARVDNTVGSDHEPLVARIDFGSRGDQGRSWTDWLFGYGD